MQLGVTLTDHMSSCSSASHSQTTCLHAAGRHTHRPHVFMQLGVTLTDHLSSYSVVSCCCQQYLKPALHISFSRSLFQVFLWSSSFCLFHGAVITSSQSVSKANCFLCHCVYTVQYVSTLSRSFVIECLCCVVWWKCVAETLLTRLLRSFIVTRYVVAS